MSDAIIIGLVLLPVVIKGLRHLAAPYPAKTCPYCGAALAWHTELQGHSPKWSYFKRWCAVCGTTETESLGGI